MLQGNNNIMVTNSEFNLCIDCYLAKMANIQGYSICPYCDNTLEN